MQKRTKHLIKQHQDNQKKVIVEYKRRRPLEPLKEASR